MPVQQAPIKGTNVNVAMMTSGGLAPCLSASIAQLVKYWAEALKAGEITGLTFRFYIGGYKGLLSGDSYVLEEADWPKCEALLKLGGSPIGNSRVKVRNEKKEGRNLKWLDIHQPKTWLTQHTTHVSTLFTIVFTLYYLQLTNIEDCKKRGFIKEGETPLEVAAQQLLKDQIHVIHTIGGDDTNTQAAHLSDYLLEKHDGKVIVIGMPKVS